MTIGTSLYDFENGYGMTDIYGSSDRNGYGTPDIDGDSDRNGYEMPDINRNSHRKASGRKSSPEECQTCKNRKYRDGSDEMVSFKSAAHISPAASASAVRAHEQEHVSNAYKDAAQNNGKVIQASVSIHTAVCPECGRSYIAGGETRTQIKYYNEENPYQQDLKGSDKIKYLGMHVDMAG